MADTPTRVRAASGVAHSLAGIGGDEETPASITDDGGTLACEGTLHVYKKFRFNPRYCTVAAGLFKIYSSRGPGHPPKKTMSIATMTWTAESTGGRRLTVDTGAEILVLRAPSVSDRNQWIRAFEREQSLLSPRYGADGGGKVGLARTASIPWHLEIGDYLLAGNPIGAGGFGDVIQGMHRSTHRRVAAKLRHKNVVSLLEVIYVDDTTVYLIMELASGGELFSKVADEGRLPADLARRFFAQVLAGAAHCHNHGVVHRDLKLENLMLDASGERVMITDFGFAKNFWESTPKTCLGTAAYVAPEVLELKPYDGTKVDAWACGVILYAMLEGDYPFGVGGGKGVGRKGDKQLHERLRRGWAAVEFPRHFQRGAIALLKRLLTADPAVRVSCQEALMDEWFQGDAAVASAVASDLRKLRGQSPPSARKSEGSFGALDSPLKINRLFTQQPPEPEPEPGAVVVVAAADQKTVLEESDATIRAADAAAEQWRRRPPPIAVGGDLSPGSYDVPIAVPLPFGVDAGGGGPGEFSPTLRVSFGSSISLGGSLDSLDLDSGAQSAPTVEPLQEADFVDV